MIPNLPGTLCEEPETNHTSVAPKVGGATGHETCRSRHCQPLREGAGLGLTGEETLVNRCLTIVSREEQRNELLLRCSAYERQASRSQQPVGKVLVFCPELPSKGAAADPRQRGLGRAMSAPRRSPSTSNQRCDGAQCCTSQTTEKQSGYFAL
jgi:hypothetical protein